MGTTPWIYSDADIKTTVPLVTDVLPIYDRAIIALTAPLMLKIPREFSAWTKFPSRSTAEASCILERWWHVLRITLRQRMERLPYCIVQMKEYLNPFKRKASCSDSISKRQTF